MQSEPVKTPAPLAHCPSPDWLKNLPHFLQPYAPRFKPALDFIAAQPPAHMEGLPLSTLAHGMAQTVIELHGDPESVLAALLYPYHCYAGAASLHRTSWCSRAIIKLLEGAKAMEYIDAIYLKQYSSPKQLENLRKMTVAMANDIRIVIIKLIEQMHLIKYFLKHSAPNQETLVQRIFDIYIPLANRLGVGHIKRQLEDDVFQYMHPKAYQQIYQALKHSRESEEQLLTSITHELQDKLKSVPSLTITSRFKHIYGIYQKMQAKKIPFEQIYDRLGLRIIVPTLTDCYHVLSLIHSLWQPIAEEFNDYIAKPKSNGYQSLHTAIIDGAYQFEIQIRTQAMHQQAEFGFASHRLYKEVQSGRGLYLTKQSCLTHLLDWQFGLTHVPPLANSDRIYVFTPQSQIIDLPQGATPIDFAYAIHSHIGNHCCGAKCHGHIVPLNYQLKTGDQIEILTHPNAKPSRDWLSQPHYLITPKARQKILQWFKQQEHLYFLLTGKAMLKKALKRQKLKLPDLDELALKFNYKQSADLLAALGKGQINLASLLNTQPITDSSSLGFTKTPPKTTSQSIQVEGIGTTLTHIAQCCKPAPSSAIIGYLTKTRGLYIHHANCPNILRKNKEQKKRLMAVTWPT